ncbi:MAG: serine/threonine protein kinase [Actinomycetota bacterium]|nr:serine/threonine protein kinase [Actinomycetota bacterium]
MTSVPAPVVAHQPYHELAPGVITLALLHEGHRINVYDAWSEPRGCRVVAKALRPDHVDDLKGARQLRAEGRVLRTLDHPHIVRWYETIPGSSPVVVLETISGFTLSALLDEHDRLPILDVLHLGLHLTSAVGYLHSKGWLHLDLKPSNVVADAGRAKLIDLSIARRPGKGVPGAGTRGYLAPEQALGQQLTAATDVWGIGGVLYESIVGEPAVPHEGGTSTRTGQRPGHLIAVPARLKTRRQVPPAVVALIDATLRIDPAQRPTIGQCATVLAEALGVSPIPHVLRRK